MEYINNFSAGQLSPLINAGTDLEVYNRGCKTVRNFYIKPQGGLERRQGSRYLTESQSEDVRLIPFVFTRNESYMMAITDEFIKILDDNGTEVKSLASPFDVSDLLDIKYIQVSDVVWMVCPNKPPHKLSRTVLSPVDFTINVVEFEFPPFLEENEDVNLTLTPQPLDFDTLSDYIIGQQVSESLNIYEATSNVTAGSAFNIADWDILGQLAVNIDQPSLKLIATDDVFNSDMVGSDIRLSHQRSNSTIIGGYTNNTTTTVHYSPEVFIGDETTQVFASTTSTYGSAIYIERKDSINGAWTVIHSISASSSQTTGSWEVIGSGTTYLRAHFTRIDVDNDVSTWSVSADYSKSIEFTSSSVAEKYSDTLDVSYSNWNFQTSDTWTGSIDIEKSIDGGGTWEILTSVIDTIGLSTTSGNTSNVKISSPVKEGANTLIRINYEFRSGTLKANLTNDTTYSEGLFKITEFIDETSVVVDIINKPMSPSPTFRWSEGAFSTYRGFPTAITLYQNRMCYSGTIEEQSTLYISHVDGYNDFLLGTNDSDAIKVIPLTYEPTTWLLEKNGLLYQGTRGSVVIYKSYDGNPIAPTNITAIESMEFSGSNIQAVKSNETVLFLERTGSKLRETKYSDEERGLISRDLTILSNEIASPLGFTELVVQKTPDQIIYGLRSDGLLASLTYERSEDVFGWSVFDFGGEVLSIAIRPTEDHDELWIVVKRINGTFIEKLGSRIFSDDLKDAWFIDSGVEGYHTTQSDRPVTIGDAPDHVITVEITDSIVEGYEVVLSNVDTFSPINNKTFIATDVTPTSLELSYDTGIKVNGVRDYMPTTLSTNDGIGGSDVSYTLQGYDVLGIPIFDGSDGTIMTGGVVDTFGSVDVTTMTLTTTDTVDAVDDFMTVDGLLYFIIVGGDPSRIAKYSLSTPFDLSTRTVLSNDQITTDQLSSLTFNPDGTRVYVTKLLNQYITQYDLQTPYDISSRTNPVLDWGGSPSLFDIQWNSDGTRFAVAENDANYPNDGGTLRIFEANTLWDIYLSQLVETYETDHSSHDGIHFIFTEDNNTLIITQGTEIKQYDTGGSFSTTNLTEIATSNVISSATGLSIHESDLRVIEQYVGVRTWDVGGATSEKWVIHDGDYYVDYISSGGFFPPQTGWEKFVNRNVTYNMEYSYPITTDTQYVSRIWDGLDHLEGETVQFIGDGNYIGEYTVKDGSITSEIPVGEAIIGLKYMSILQPMPIESGSFVSNSYNKTIMDACIMFYRSGTCYSGLLIQNDDREPEMDFDYLNENFPNVDTCKYEMEPLTLRSYNDELGVSIKPFTGSKLVNYNDTYSRIKSQFIIIDTPEPMTIQAISINLNITGGN